MSTTVSGTKEHSRPIAATAPSPAGGGAPDVVQPGGDRREAEVRELVRQGFREVLDLETVDDSADFFDLGGDSLMALSLLQQIEEALGVNLPISALYDATTIEALASRLTYGFPAQAEPALIELRPAQAPHPGAPLFLLHGLGGSVMVLRDLARAMPGRRAVWGIEAKGLSGEAPPLENVEAMAEHALARIRRVAPHGPYLLAGYSFGGLVALEAARQLRAQGETVALLALLDSFPHPRHWRLAPRIGAALRQAEVYASLTTWKLLWQRERQKLRGKTKRESAGRLARGAWRAVTLPADVLGMAWVYDLAGRAPRPAEMLAPLNRGAVSAATADAIEAVTDATRRAFAAYAPRFYAGEMTVLHATERQVVPFTPRAVWGHLAEKLTVIDLPTDHQALVRGSARATAAEIGRAIDAGLGNDLNA